MGKQQSGTFDCPSDDSLSFVFRLPSGLVPDRRVASFGPFVLLAQEVNFGGIQRCVERQPQLGVDMHQGDKLFFPFRLCLSLIPVMIELRKRRIVLHPRWSRGSCRQLPFSSLRTRRLKSKNTVS